MLQRSKRVSKAELPSYISCHENPPFVYIRRTARFHLFAYLANHEMHTRINQGRQFLDWRIRHGSREQPSSLAVKFRITRVEQNFDIILSQVSIEFRFIEFSADAVNLPCGNIIADIDLAWTRADNRACGYHIRVSQSCFPSWTLTPIATTN